MKAAAVLAISGGLLFAVTGRAVSAPVVPAPPGKYVVSWIGNSFSGASNRWVQNFFIHTQVQPDGTVNTWSHWDEGGHKFGVYKDGDVIGNQDVKANSLRVKDDAGHVWEIAIDWVDPKYNEFDFKPKGILCDGQPVTFPDLIEPTALAMAKDGSLMVADSQTSVRQQVLFYDVSDQHKPKLKKTFGAYGGIGSGTPGEVTSTKLWGIRGLGMDDARNLYIAMSEMGSCLRKYSRLGGPVVGIACRLFRRSCRG